ncbi:MAG: dTDP-4-dehydrorhamnose 3,5-epimerase [Bacillati bacterium ANGP1]|uniref:dTDP-4-dehydrorhamnose 3,5-epimerase n=1 Tax=Candidatus Segetimicrobium genomatis TaxID=2569760 RepID=A0A537JFN2_9BACT|nr:MAG: dTDP-4-dehydrorhamnose 3,5-epimerase [Terrabacteria group bacterium ANGP1]
MGYRFEPLEVRDVVLIQPAAFPDHRGFFMEMYKHSEFAAHGIDDPFVQDNYSHSVRGVLRGLHFQLHPQAQQKLVGVIRGEIFDVAVDIRAGSPTYGRWVGVTLSAENRRLLYVPAGFAHGFCALSDEADVVYKVTAEYAPDLDGGILWNDPALGIRWPIAEPILSPKDTRLPLLREAKTNFVYTEERSCVCS